jgi:subtilisin family serine protease
VDPKLAEEIAVGEGADEVKAIVRLRNPDHVPSGVRIIARFGNIATCRLQRDQIVAVHEDERVESVKAAELLREDDEIDPLELEIDPLEGVTQSDERRPEGLEARGRGVVCAAIGFGMDFCFPSFRHADGSTRLLGLWNMRGSPAQGASNRYGYGTIYDAKDINRALATDNPYRTLGYHPADSDPEGNGAHETAVLHIAAGNDRAGIPAGIAPEAELVFVELATERITGGLTNLGDSVTLLESLHFVLARISDRSTPAKCAINFSLGAHGGPHTRWPPVVQGLDAALAERPGLVCCCSAGNYYNKHIHASGRILPGRRRTLVWEVDEADVTPNELEVWYSDLDVFRVEVHAPDGKLEASVPLGKQGSLSIGGREVCKIYHRANEPNNRKHHIDIFHYPGAPSGEWRVTLIGEDIVQGDWDAWVERDSARPGSQSRFHRDDDDPLRTTNSICNGSSIAVGAYDSHKATPKLPAFTSSGPSADGLLKPECIAPGVNILTARSAPRDAGISVPSYTLRTGSSFAAPVVTGTAVLMLGESERPLWNHEVRRLLLDTATPVAVPPEHAARVGSGLVNIKGAVEAARRAGSAGAPTPVPSSVVTEPREGQPAKEEAVMNQGELEGVTAPEDHAYEEQAHGGNEDVWSELSDVWSSYEGHQTAEGWRETMPDDFGSRLIGLVEEAVLPSDAIRSSSAALSYAFERAGMREPVNPVTSKFPTPGELFNAFTLETIPQLRQHFSQFFEVVGAPRQRLPEGALQAGDMLVRKFLGEPGGHIAVVANAALLPYEQVIARGIRPESNRPGCQYVMIVEGGYQPHTRAEPFARILLDETGLLQADTLLLRPLAQDWRERSLQEQAPILPSWNFGTRLMNLDFSNPVSLINPGPPSFRSSFPGTRDSWINQNRPARARLRPREPLTNVDGLPIPDWVDEQFVFDKLRAHYDSQQAELTAAELARGYSREPQRILGSNPAAPFAAAAPVAANYFVVHDTAGTRDRTNNDVVGSDVHLWIGRVSLARSRDWNVAGGEDATKLEGHNNHCFVHIELTRAIQGPVGAAAADADPRATISTDRAAGSRFTGQQLEDLANAYIVVSLRRGRFLTVTTHKELDRSATNWSLTESGHNDPEDFDVQHFYELITTKLMMPPGTTYGIEQARVNTPNQRGQVNEFIEYVRGNVAAADQYGPVRRQDQHPTAPQGDAPPGPGNRTLVGLYRLPLRTATGTPIVNCGNGNWAVGPFPP